MLKHPFGIYNFTVKSYDSDKNGKLTLPALFHFLQECAWNNARMNDFGYEYLKQENAFWVLSRILVQMDEYPNWKDKVEIKTWPKGADGFFALRDFEISMKGKIIGRVTSSWLILDMKTRRPRKLIDFNFIHENFLQEQAIEIKLGKIICKDELRCLEQRKVYYSDLDVNKHVNNATYVRWVLDSFFSDNNSELIFELQINFISELLLNDEFCILQTQNSADCFYSLQNIQQKDVCKVRIKIKNA